MNKTFFFFFLNKQTKTKSHQLTDLIEENKISSEDAQVLWKGPLGELAPLSQSAVEEHAPILSLSAFFSPVTRLWDTII